MGCGNANESSSACAAQFLASKGIGPDFCNAKGT